MQQAICICLFADGSRLKYLECHRVWYAAALCAATLSFIVAMLLQARVVSSGLFSVIPTVGVFWVAVMLYGFLILLLIDILRLTVWAAGVRPDFIYRNYPMAKMAKAVMFATACLVISVILVAGYINAHRLQTVHLKIPVSKQAGRLASLRVVMTSDLHLGHISKRGSLARIVDEMNSYKPDIVLLVGDIFDGAYSAVIEKDMCAEFDRLQVRYGTYAVSGNHEYIGVRGLPGALDAAFAYLASHDVQPLQDSSVMIDGSFYVAGRKDLSAGSRKTVPELLHGTDRQLPVIMLDHQPYRLDAAAQFCS